MSAEDIAKYGDKVLEFSEKAMMWGSEKTHIPVGALIIIAAILFVIWKFTPLFRRPKG